MERTTFDRELRRYRVVRDSDFQGATCCPRSSAAIAATLQQQSTRAQWSSKAKVKLEGVWAAMGAELERHGDSPEEARATVDRISDLHETHILHANLEQIEEELASLANRNQ